MVTIFDILRKNAKMRRAWLGGTWGELAVRGGESPQLVYQWLFYCRPTLRTVSRLGRILGVPVHALLDPEFDPRVWPPPDARSAE